MGLSTHYFTKSAYIIEGMDMVGKTTFLENNLPNHRVYHCRHDLTDNTGHRQDSWIMGYGVVDFLEQTQVPDICDTCDTGIVIDRGVFSSYVYERLYNRRYIDPQILAWYAGNDFFKNKIGHIYIRHHSADTAAEIFEKAQSREENPNEISRKYDQFNSFHDYWMYYNAADALFRDVYKHTGVTPRVFETMPNMTWNEVRMK